jgi:cell wall assembly regulator SMI1
MNKDVAATWAGIEAWANEHRPELVAELRGPASADDLAALRDCGLPVPEALLQSLAIHDGEDEMATGGLFPHGVWLSAGAIVQHLEMMADVRESLGEHDIPDSPTLGPVHSHAFSEHWLPIIDANGDVVWYLDFDPAPGGTVGQVIRVDAEGGEWLVCAPDYATFLAMWHDDLVEGRLHDEDGEPADEGYWPPFARAPAFQPGVLTEATLFALGEMGRWDEALAFAESLPASPAFKLRLQARAHQHDEDPMEALRALDALAALGEESTDDVLVRIDVLDNAGQAAAAQAALEQALATRPAGALYVRRAALVKAQAENPPVQGRKAQMKWLASPAGQQAAARANEVAVADYDAALALEDRFDWRVERIGILLDAERWDEAEADAVALIAHIEANPDAAPRDAFEQVRDLIEQAQARGEDRDDGEDMVASMDELLAGFQQMLGGNQTRGMADLKELRDALAGLMDDETREKAAFAAEPDSTRRRASEIADNIARLHADIPERFAPFDAADLDPDALGWYDATRDALVAEGFAPLADVEPLRNTELNGQRVLLRVLRSADERSVAMAWRIAHPLADYEIVDLESELDDGSVLLTNNAGPSNPFAQPDSIRVVSLARGTGMAELVRAHRMRLDGQVARPLADLDAVLALQERQRIAKRDAARARGWVGDGELRSLLGASYHELADAVRAELSARL